MGDEVRKQQENQDVATHEPSLPLFDKLNSEQKASTQKNTPESVDRASEADSRVKGSNPTPSIPVPAFLVGEDGYASKVKEFITPASTTQEATHPDIGTLDDHGADVENAQTETINLQEPNEATEDESPETANEEKTVEASEAAADSKAEMNDEAIAVSEPLEPLPPARKEMSIWPWLRPSFRLLRPDWNGCGKRRSRSGFSVYKGALRCAFFLCFASQPAL